MAAEDGLLDEFCDALWLEDGLSRNTLESYRRDLRLFAEWLASERGKTLLKARGVPRQSARRGNDYPTDAPCFCHACLLRWLRSTDRTRCQTSDMEEGQHSYGDSS